MRTGSLRFEADRQQGRISPRSSNVCPPARHPNASLQAGQAPSVTDLLATAFAEGDTALSLNPLDPGIRTVYGTRLIVVGQYDRGIAMLREALSKSVQAPTWLKSYLLLAAYLKGKPAIAAQDTNLDINETHPLNLLVRALSATKNGDLGQGRKIIERLQVFFPAFRDHPRRELEKFIPAQEIVDRLAQDLAPVGFRSPN